MGSFPIYPSRVSLDTRPPGVRGVRTTSPVVMRSHQIDRELSVGRSKMYFPLVRRLHDGAEYYLGLVLGNLGSDGGILSGVVEGLWDSHWVEQLLSLVVVHYLGLLCYLSPYVSPVGLGCLTEVLVLVTYLRVVWSYLSWSGLVGWLLRLIVVRVVASQMLRGLGLLVGGVVFSMWNPLYWGMLPGIPFWTSIYLFMPCLGHLPGESRSLLRHYMHLVENIPYFTGYCAVHILQVVLFGDRPDVGLVTTLLTLYFSPRVTGGQSFPGESYYRWVPRDRRPGLVYYS